MPESEPSFLAILFENTSSLWSTLQKTKELSPEAFIQHLLVFIRSHSLLDDANQLAVFGVGQGGTTLLHATSGCLPTLTQLAAPDLTSMDSATSLVDRLRQLANQADAAMSIDTPSTSAPPPIAWSSALLRALCFIRKLHATAAANNKPSVKARILCISSSPDDPAQYLATMNAIFAAQRAQVILDACVLGQGHSSFMQQASYLTGGTYLKPAKPGAFVQYLMTSFAADAASREFLQLPKATGVDFRASCFCHKRPTALGYVCSVCLSIYCEKVSACSTCGTNFPANVVATKLPGPT